jgi:hypothetical protein
MHNSFVSYIVRHFPGQNKRYIRGPGMDGFDMASIVSTGYSYLHLWLAGRKDYAIYLTGYSRGGSGVIGVAQRLNDVNVKVKSMMLFDAVDRALGVSTSEIPNNVERVVHARRDPHLFSRDSFGNCGTRWSAPTKVEMKFFAGTHGAVGGVPDPVPHGKRSSDFVKEFGELIPSTVLTYQQDHAAAKTVWAWAQPRLWRDGFFGPQKNTIGNV